MKIPDKARYDYVACKSSEFITEENITYFPISPYEIIKRHKWALNTYSSLAKQMSCTIDDISAAFRTDEAYTIFNGNNYTIAYNDAKYADRIWFTLMHEIGHIYLNHFKDFEKTIIRRGEMSKGEYKILENEANAFARNVLSPAPIVEQLNEKSTDKLCIYFHLSKDAASARLDFLHSDMYWNNYTKVTFKIISRFMDYFNNKHCNICNSTSTAKSNFCPICGSNSLLWGNGKMKYPVKIKVNEKSKALRCPICDNEEISPEGAYCFICGCELINRCTNFDDYGNGCGALAAANARYCIYCGAETTFFQNKLLIPWDEEKKSLNKGISLDTIMNDWDTIINKQGGGARSYLRNTLLENGGNDCICIVFPDSMSYDMGRRPTVISELERYIENHYEKSVYFKTRLQNMPILPDGVEYEGLPL